ncbi:hypothetical protein [Flammeovirga kamogawensis]|uniref:Oligosaccharide repeat unit polymerase n=1 Tax=Flammeovirga kamogawensis TaxID=373891 RepID=A0ABX8GYJ6_9BACT|nr:hypothetical protein [Flammeovirga kamogawensis]MBB6458897.1 hypothetical protein [Flammeovirga kamogawensis]QWG08478.1 hypothetical protein KM029_05945 [Flammeovirga kamogawensis]TRX66773.1 hypothetical protein EO216_01000 [Flammeovirga kamogawensis]
MKDINNESSLFISIYLIFENLITIPLIYLYIFKNIPNKIKLLFLILIIINIALGFLSGMKEDIIKIFVILFLFSYFFKEFDIKKIIIPILIFLILYPISNNYRSNINSGFYNNKTEALQNAFFVTLNDGINLTNSYNNYSDRSDISFYYYSAFYVKNKWYEYQELNRYIFLPIYWFIPRIVWNDKPKKNIGNEYYQLLTNRTSINSQSIGTFGWAYLEGFFSGLFPFALLGLFIKNFQYFFDRNHNLFSFLIVNIFLIFLLKLENDIFFFITGLLKSLFLLMLILKILRINKI